jgi:hypothetical protein
MDAAVILTAALLLSLVQLVVLHFPDGYEIRLNPAHIITLRETSEAVGHQNRLLVRGAHCVVGLSSAKFIAVAESCTDVQRLVQEAR